MTLSSYRYSIGKYLFGMIVIICAQSSTLWAQGSGTDETVIGASMESATAVPSDDAAPGLNAVDRPGEPRIRWTREWLEGHGVTLELGYRAEMFSNLRGGTDGKRGGEYLGSADSTITLDLAKLHLGRGAVVVTGQSLHGRSINDRKVGAVQTASNLDNPQFNKLVEAYFTDSLLKNRVTFKVGRLYADADFNVIENGADFLNSSYGLIPTVPMPTYPAPQVGATMWTILNSHVAFGAGLYRGADLDGLDESAVPTRTGLFTVVETKVSPYAKDSAFHGSYHVGMWRQAESAWNTDNPIAPVGNYGVFVTGDHWFRKATSVGANEGPGVFFQVGWAPSDRNEISSYWGAGAAYPGFLSRRPQDSIGAGVTQARLVAGNETVLEIFYKFQATRRLFVQPDMQWVSRPSGVGHDALLGGVRVGIVF